MANLIITVIAIALVAVASLMGAYYGGSAFLNNQSAAAASTALNQGQQVQGAWNAYLSDNLNTPPANISSLVTAGYLAQVPNSPAAAGSVSAAPITVGTATATVGGVSGTHYFAWANVGAPSSSGAGTVSDPNASACARIVKTAVGGTGSITGSGAMNTAAPGGIATKTGTSGSGNGTFGCAYTSAATTAGISGAIIPTGQYVMEYMLQ